MNSNTRQLLASEIQWLVMSGLLPQASYLLHFVGDPAVKGLRSLKQQSSVGFLFRRKLSSDSAVRLRLGSHWLE